ncbi:MAG: hypothetical protein JWL76_767 [Thermoleophilia bacterium]|nr:hypothetical protein [Thermoleophilia bacterium]
MQMTLTNRVKDMLPVLIVFFVVACFGTMVFIEYVAHDPVVVPAPEHTANGELPHPVPFVPTH